MPRVKRTADIGAPVASVFTYVDDIRNLARHMSEKRSMAMMGSRLTLEIMTPEPTGVGATYRYSGRMMGLTIDFSEIVTRHVPGREKTWRTIGEPRLLILGGYEMGVSVEPVSETTSRLTISLDYDLPRSGLWRMAGRVLAPWYAHWCLDSMVEGAKRDLEQGK